MLTFDGINKLIGVNPGVTEVLVKDIYSKWKLWITQDDNAKYLPAFRVTGGDPIGGDQYTGDVYFLINNWRILVDHSCNFDGVIYSDDFPSPFIQLPDTYLVTNKVSALVTLAQPQVSLGGASLPNSAENAAAVWQYATRTLTNADTIVSSMDANSVKLAQIKALIESIEVPTTSETASAVWSTPTNTLTDKNTVGGYIAKVLLSIPKFLGLK